MTVRTGFRHVLRRPLYTMCAGLLLPGTCIAYCCTGARLPGNRQPFSANPLLPSGPPSLSRLQPQRSKLSLSFQCDCDTVSSTTRVRLTAAVIGKYSLIQRSGSTPESAVGLPADWFNRSTRSAREVCVHPGLR